MNNLKVLFLISLTCISISSSSQEIKKNMQSTAIAINKTATHVAEITETSVVVISGSTYSFTVDTPEDEGLVSTAIDVSKLTAQITSKGSSVQRYQVMDPKGLIKENGVISNGDQLVVTAQDGKTRKIYPIQIKAMAIAGKLLLQQKTATINTANELIINFTAGQRSPDATVNIFLPAGIEVDPKSTTVNIIGRGAVNLADLSKQSIGRVGTAYPYSKVGSVAITRSGRETVLTFSQLDLRPANGPDLQLIIKNLTLKKPGDYLLKANYTTSKPEKLSSPLTGAACAILHATNRVSTLERVANNDLPYKDISKRYAKVILKWGLNKDISNVKVMQSTDRGRSWKVAAALVDIVKGRATLSGLLAERKYIFKLHVGDGPNKGFSNEVHYFSGKTDVRSFGITGDGISDNTEKINLAIDALHNTGGGTLHFTTGVYNVRTIHLKSNVYLFLDKTATIQAIKGNDAPEHTWFSDKKYRSGLSPTDRGPYDDPENYMTKQDVGHHYFRNTMFFAERIDNVKIIGNGLITGNGNLVNSDKVMNNPPDNRADKMFTFKLCTNIEIGGIYRPEDLWYDPKTDEPYYIGENGGKITDVNNMLRIERAGHFVLLATGTDNIYVHNTYFAKDNQSNARDIYDFMGCNNVTATNIYSKVSSDDIIKPGSDCSLGFTRPASNYKVRNIIGDTNCNLFQIGSETADDIKSVCVDNIYVLGANKAGFSISTNDGGHISDIHLNCGHTGRLHSRSEMYRTRAPFFISISNRGRILGANAGRYVFMENGIKHDELLIKNVNIGRVENIILNGIDIFEVYGGSSYGGKNGRWKAYDGSQDKATPIIAGYKLPDHETVTGGLDFKLPNGLHTGYISNIVFNDINVLVKGGNPITDTTRLAPELGVGQYNVANLHTQPSYGIWARHVHNLSIKNCSFNYEKRDSRYAIFLDDVKGAHLSGLKLVKPTGNPFLIKLKNSTGVSLNDIVYFKDEWGNSALKRPDIYQKELSSTGF